MPNPTLQNPKKFKRKGAKDLRKKRIAIGPLTPKGQCH
jgi:hypothetical protein